MSEHSFLKEGNQIKGGKLALACIYLAFFDIAKVFKDAGILKDKMAAPDLTSQSSVKSSLSRLLNKIVSRDQYFPKGRTFQFRKSESDVTFDVCVDSFKRVNHKGDFNYAPLERSIDLVEKSLSFEMEYTIKNALYSAPSQNDISPVSHALFLNNKEMLKLFADLVMKPSRNDINSTLTTQLEKFRKVVVEEYDLLITTNTAPIEYSDRELQMKVFREIGDAIGPGVSGQYWLNFNTRLKSGFDMLPLSFHLCEDFSLPLFMKKAFADRYGVNMSESIRLVKIQADNAESYSRGNLSCMDPYSLEYISDQALESRPVYSINFIRYSNTRTYLYLIPKRLLSIIDNRISFSPAGLMKYKGEMNVYFNEKCIDGDAFKESLDHLLNKFETAGAHNEPAM